MFNTRVIVGILCVCVSQLGYAETFPAEQDSEQCKTITASYLESLEDSSLYTVKAGSTYCSGVSCVDSTVPVIIGGVIAAAIVIGSSVSK